MPEPRLPTRWIGTAILITLVIALQIWATAVDKEYYLTQVIMAVYYSVVVLGLCLVMGYAGQISLGHGAFFALGGYISAVLTTHPLVFASSVLPSVLTRCGILVSRPDLYGQTILTVTPWAAFIAAMLVTWGVAALIGYPALRLKGHYLAMATLGFGLIVYRMLLGSEITGGADGITSVPPWRLVPGLVISGHRAVRIPNYYLAWGVAVLTLSLLLNLVHSRVGRALRAIHDSEIAANAMGVNTAALKLKTFIISAMLAALAGCCLTHYNGGIGPSEAGAMKSVRYVTLVAVGGMANLWGALLMSVMLTFLSLRGVFGSMDHAVFGTILIAIISLAPQGPLRPVAEGFARLRGVLRTRIDSAGVARGDRHGLA